jgi:hypothetical protein
MENKFQEIFSKYDTDKTFYSEAYEECFGHIRDDVQLVFEIGVNRGGSMRAWKEYFPNALIVGLEKNSHCFFEEERISIEIGNATKQNFIDAVMNKHGWPDIVIDDGSHKSRDIKASYELLHRYTQRYYVIEDLSVQTPDVKNGFYINDGEPATSVIYKEAEKLLLYRNYCKSIKVYHSIVFFCMK